MHKIGRKINKMADKSAPEVTTKNYLKSMKVISSPIICKKNCENRSNCFREIACTKFVEKKRIKFGTQFFGRMLAARNGATCVKQKQ